MQKHKEPDIHAPVVSMETISFRTCLQHSHDSWGAAVIGWQLEVTWPFLAFLFPASFAALPRPTQRVISCLTTWGRSLPLPPSDIKMTLLHHRCDVLMQHAAAEEVHGTFFFFFRLHPTCPFLYPPGPLLGRYCWSYSLTLRLDRGHLCLFIGQRGQSRVYQWGGRKQFKPANHHVGQVQIVQ